MDALIERIDRDHSTAMPTRSAEDGLYLTDASTSAGMEAQAVSTKGHFGEGVESPTLHRLQALLSGKPVGGYAKRGFDIAFSLLAIIALLPLLLSVMLLCAIGGSPIYKQARMGYCGRTFSCYKFRTMVLNGDEVLEEYFKRHPDQEREWNTNRKLRDDPRVTRIGKFLRKTSLDELPQFFNVLFGDMSCVGPRPLPLAEVVLYGRKIATYKLVRPGLTGKWQISGRSEISFAERIMIEADYVESWSFWTDLSIMARTPGAVLRLEGAY